MKIEIIAFLIFGFNSFGILLLLLASLIVLKKRKSLGSILLCLFSIGFGCYQMANQLIEMLYLNGNSPQLQILILIGNLAGIITAPLLYFSIHLLLDKAFKIRPFHILFILPAIPAITIILILASKEQILNFHMSQTFSNEKIIYPAIFAAYLATYITLFFIAILKIILKNKSKISRKFAATISVIIILTILRDIFDFLSLYQIAGVFLTISIIVIFTKIITNPNIIELLGTELTKNHYRKSRLTNINIPETVEKIEKMMKEKKLYLDPNLKLPALAKKVGITTEQLSEIINLHYKNNFNQFINKFRINYAEELKSKFPEKKMLDIAYESGFNSSSSFYTAYKQQKEKNPRQKN